MYRSKWIVEDEDFVKFVWPSQETLTSSTLCPRKITFVLKQYVVCVKRKYPQGALVYTSMCLNCFDKRCNLAS